MFKRVIWATDGSESADKTLELSIPTRLEDTD